MDLITLSLAKKYTDEKISNGGGSNASIQIDTTLSQSGAAADAKIVGEKIDSHEARITKNEQAIEALESKEVDLTGYATEEYVDDVMGVGVKTVEDIYVDNALALTSWNGGKIVSAIDDEVVFTTETAGNRGVRVLLKNKVDSTKPLYVKYTVSYDPSVKVFFNIFSVSETGSSTLLYVAQPASDAEKVHSIDLSGKDCSLLNLIFYSPFSDDTIGQEISVSSLNVWQEKEVAVSTITNHEERIAELENNQVAFIAPNGENYVLQVSADGNLIMTPVVPSKALFIGNSLLLGFGTFGMAASDSKHDYYYLVNEAITEKKSNYTASRMSGTTWEGATTAEAQEAFMNGTLLPKLSEDLELVIVQLGDNVNSDEKKAVFAEGSRNLLEFIRSNAPKARVAWVGAWYQTDEKQEQMIESCKKTGSTFVNIRDIVSSATKNAIGNTYTDDNGVVHTIDNAGVASHPNDKGFRLIANRILYTLGIVDTPEYYVG